MLQLQPRVNKDHVIDSSGRRLLLLCQMSYLIIANGRFHQDKEKRSYTYCSHNGLSIVDYLLLNPNDIPFVTDFAILEFNEFSDHAPVYFTLQSKSFQPKQARPEIHEKQSASLLCFDSDKVPLFRTYLLNNNDVLTGLMEQVNTGSIDGIIKDFTMTFMYDNG